jgi:ElaB/YqjD/DUF883 family membrane-anchored ribosome-binding protein
MSNTNPTAPNITRAKLENGVHSTYDKIADTASAAKESITEGLGHLKEEGARLAGQAADKLKEVKAKAGQWASSAAESAGESLETVMAKLREFGKQTGAYARAHPVKTFAVAATAGWLIGRMFRRG